MMAGVATWLGPGATSVLAASAEPFNMKFSPEFGLFEDIAGKDDDDPAQQHTQRTRDRCAAILDHQVGKQRKRDNQDGCRKQVVKEQQHVRQWGKPLHKPAPGVGRSDIPQIIA